VDLVRAKRANRVNYWIAYHLANKLKWEKVGESIEEARDADGKRRSQKRENRIFDIKPESKMTFKELATWYLGLEKVKGLKYFPTKKILLDKFNSELGSKIVGEIKPVDLENLQAKRKREGMADASIDAEIGEARTMIIKAFDNDKVGGEVIKVFKKVKKLLKRNSNARKRILNPMEFDNLYQYLPLHSKQVLAIGFYTGMRRSEILSSLTWYKVSLVARTIKLEAKYTKDKEAREIPICDQLYSILKAIPRNLHDNHVILYWGKPIKNIQTSLETASKKAGIIYGKKKKDGFIFHDLRHTFNTYMRKAGVSESVIMEITGHSTREMFDRYNTIDEEDKKQAIDQFEGFLCKVAANVSQTVNKTGTGEK
jgi:integrase